MIHEDYLITLNVPPDLEDAVVDCLLNFDNNQGFTSFAINAHDHQQQLGLSLAEQVSGRQRKIRFQMHVDKKSVAEVVNTLKNDFSGAGMRYWVMPLLGHGVL